MERAGNALSNETKNEYNKMKSIEEMKMKCTKNAIK